MSLPQSAAILGLGLIGGSLARDLARRGVRVCAHDRDPVRVQQAMQTGVVHQMLGSSLGGIEECAMVILAAPVSASAELLACVAARHVPGCVVTDVGSTKRSTMEAASRAGVGAWFVGSHPMAGDHHSGFDASREGLFAGARVYVTPSAETSAGPVSTVEALWRSVGGRPERIDPAEHDRRLAWTSHLPHLLSSALAHAIAERGILREELGPGGHDMTRLAASCPDLWSGVATDNAAAIGEALEAAEAEIGYWRQALLRGDERAIRERFGEARRWASP